MKISDLTHDKDFLRSLIDNGFQLPEGVNAYSFCIDLLPNLGSPDPILRDELTATILDGMVSSPDRITGEQARRILSVCLDDEHLFWRIGEQNTDSVFMRSFSALLSSSLIDRDSREETTDLDFIRDSIERILRYSTTEIDMRGFVHNKGWAHSVAHLSDALYASAGHKAALQQHLAQILKATEMLSGYDHPMSSGESERLAYAACRAISRINDKESVMKWIRTYSVPEANKNSPYAIYNSNNFLRSLYFDLKWEGNDPRFLDGIEGKLRRLDPLYRNSEKV